jgi:GR25 family glycosyltransferase involved in LPS biosynthesis
MFNNTFVLNLDRRPDRLELVNKQLSKHNINYIRVSAIDGKLLENVNPKIGNGWNHVGVAGCLLSHRKILDIAISRDLENYLVVEDDTILDDNFQNIHFYLKQLPLDWDVVYIGGLHLGPLKPVNVNIARCTHTLVTNMFAVNKKFYKVLREHWPDNVNDLVQPADLVLASLQSKYNFYTIKPHLAWQDSIFSDIENKSQDLPHLRPTHPKASLIISSFNQKDRLKFSLQSALKQSYYNYEVIVADDNSTDGTVDMIKKDFPGVKFTLNPNSEKDIYTLAENWNTAANVAEGERYIFSNADCVFPKGYIAAHMDTSMSNDIIFGPNERTDECIESLIETSIYTKQLLEEYLKISESGFGKDLRHDSSAYTYNKEYNYYYPWGNNMSVPSKSFKEVKGFPKLKEYGGEEILLSKKLQTKKGLKVKSNVNAINIHLWHPVVNKLKQPFNENLYKDYIDDL